MTRRLQWFEAAAADRVQFRRQGHRPTARGASRRELAAQTTAPSTQRAVQSLWVIGWFSTTPSARGPGVTELGSFDYDSSKPKPATWRGVGEEEPRPTAWGETRPALAAKTTTPSSRRASHGPWAVGWFSTGRGASGPRATELEGFVYGVSKPQPPTWRGVLEEEPRPTVRGGARTALAAKTTTPSPRRAVCRPWAVGWFSTGRRARGPRTTELESVGYGVSKPQPPTRRGVGEEKLRPTTRGGARRELPAQTTTPSPPARTCTVGGRLVLHGAKRA